MQLLNLQLESLKLLSETTCNLLIGGYHIISLATVVARILAEGTASLDKFCG